MIFDPDALRRITKIATEECIRQQVGLNRVAELLTAYAIAYQYGADGIDIPMFSDVLRLGELIEASNRGLLRYTPVTFADGSHAIPAHNVPHAMDRLMANVPTDHPDRNSVDYWIKSFLDIHPFIDGNGRTAWLLRVWLLNQWENPEPLPDYYGS